MKQFLLLTVVSILVFGKVNGQQKTYAQLADSFMAKATLADKKNRIFWGDELRTVFTIYQNISQTDAFETLSKTVLFDIIKPVENGLNRFPYEMDVIETNGQFGVILSNQHKVNDLYNELSEELQSKASAEGAYYNRFFNSPLAKEKLSGSRLKRVFKDLYTMKTNQKKFQTLLGGELSALKTEKATFLEDIQTLLCVAQTASSVADISSALSNFKASQDEVWDRLKVIRTIVLRYYTERDIWADFVVGYRKSLDASLELFKQIGAWEKGLKAVKKSPNKLKKMLTKKR
ncbi:uncharacterized protein LOC116346334 [Contarinia nasturtii]|uniref:uncharacterized protein LOC116346334 n=1 Tax=Contarinia nasturtii TaxID=265458 RepID=UPI0012D3B8AA|nr:uncharacterized protein LOC116346334 [Contarinia nasturtii]